MENLVAMQTSAEEEGTCITSGYTGLSSQVSVTVHHGQYPMGLMALGLSAVVWSSSTGQSLQLTNGNSVHKSVNAAVTMGNHRKRGLLSANYHCCSNIQVLLVRHMIVAILQKLEDHNARLRRPAECKTHKLVTHNEMDNLTPSQARPHEWQT
jgi:hypothetical protein